MDFNPQILHLLPRILRLQEHVSVVRTAALHQAAGSR